MDGDSPPIALRRRLFPLNHFQNAPKGRQSSRAGRFCSDANAASTIGEILSANYKSLSSTMRHTISKFLNLMDGWMATRAVVFHVYRSSPQASQNNSKSIETIPTIPKHHPAYVLCIPYCIPVIPYISIILYILLGPDFGRLKTHGCP